MLGLGLVVICVSVYRDVVVLFEALSPVIVVGVDLLLVSVVSVSARVDSSADSVMLVPV